MRTLACLLLAPALAAQTERPNVVLIVSDDQAWTDFGFMGHEVIETPNLDRLAAQSLVFERGHVPASLCRPSLATIITGLYPHQHKITGNDPKKGMDRGEMLRHIDRATTLPEMLAARGYASLQTGKWWEGSYRRGGFTHGMTHGDPKRRGRHGDKGLEIGRKGMGVIREFVEEHAAKPFLIWYAPFLPHTPHNPPKRLLDKYRAEGRTVHVARYFAMCEWFDETCGELMGILKENELDERTVVVFVADNGWIQRPDRRGFAPRSKRSPYEGGVRTPIMVRWPGKVGPARSKALASSIDIVPTVLAACGVGAPASLPGVDLRALARGDIERDRIFGASFTHDVADIDDPARSLRSRWVISGEHKLIVPAGAERAPELYDLIADPHERRDLAGRDAGRVRALGQALDGWWRG